MPMLPALYLSLTAGIFYVLSNLFNQFLLALGKAKTVRNIYILWAISQWILTILLVKLWDYNGAVVADLIVSATFFIPLLKLKREIKFNVSIQIVPYLLMSILTFIFVYLLKNILVIESFINLISVAGIGLCFYLILILLFDRKKILEEFTEFIKYTKIS
jgi:O-antigen/teichoic acid export membrane protein